MTNLSNIRIMKQEDFLALEQTSNDTLYFVEGIDSPEETYIGGTSWYRVYSDGWCEQGGEGTASSAATDYSVVLLKTMANTNYNIQLTLNRSTSASGDYYIAYTSKSTSSFTIQCRPTGFSWRVSGYISGY